MKVHPAEAGLVIGNRDMAADAVSLRVHVAKAISARNLGMKPLPTSFNRSGIGAHKASKREHC